MYDKAKLGSSLEDYLETIYILQKEQTCQYGRFAPFKEGKVMSELLKIENMNVQVEEKTILRDICMSIKPGETHVLMGPNGAGKSTLGYALMGNPKYEVTKGNIYFKGSDVTQEDAVHRAKQGMFLSFQEPLEVPGLSLESFLRNAMEQKTGKRMKLWDFRKEMEAAMDILKMDHSYGNRSLNSGFSGGEKKKTEILQMLLFKPELAILDETDSGLDIDAVHLVSEGVKAYQQERKGALLIITHSTRILDSLHIDYTHVMVDGRIITTGDASLIKYINEEGYENFFKLADQNKEAQAG